jgi:hypothetical protein
MNKICPYYSTEDDYHSEGWCIAYWRKCWGIRGAILYVLDPQNKKSDQARHPIELEDIPAIIRALKPFLSKDYWENEAESIWEYEEYFDNMYEILIKLEWLKQNWNNLQIKEVYFYDSY